MPEEHVDRVFEGLDTRGIASDILEERLPALYDLIYRDFPADGPEKFSEEFMYELKRIAG